MFGHDQNTGFSTDIKATAEWIDASLPKTAVLLMHDAGGISEFAHHRAGLKTPLEHRGARAMALAVVHGATRRGGD